MNERNTNRRTQTHGNRTTQRHQIDGRPAPRRQASHTSEYSEGSFTQPPQNAFRSRTASISAITALAPTAEPSAAAAAAKPATPQPAACFWLSNRPVFPQNKPHAYPRTALLPDAHASPRNQHLRSPWLLEEAQQPALFRGRSGSTRCCRFSRDHLGRSS